jgi:hypothetical protein
VSGGNHLVPVVVLNGKYLGHRVPEHR